VSTVVTGQTRFFCRCGRLITVDGSTREVVCPTCKQRNVVPGGETPAPPPMPVAPPRALAPAPPAPPAIDAAAGSAAAPAAAGNGAATAILDLRIGGRLGRFELQRVLGHGGMGTVYQARDESSGRDVALKVLHPVLQSRPDFLSRFQREARAASSLNHENIVRILDSGIERGSPWIAMELVEGEDLLAAAQRGAVTPQNAPQVMLQAARGLSAAAAVGITHRDVKPGNLVLRRDGVLKVADFGLAKEIDSTSKLTVTGEVLGTPHYMAPEQGRGERADLRSDLYSLGATFYHVLGGAPPHEADTPVGVILKHLREEPIALRTRNAAVAPGLERIVHRLLQKSPDQRYQSYAALSDDLERVARGDEPIAGADPPARRVTQGDTTFLVPEQGTTELVLKPAGFFRRMCAFAVDMVAIDLILWLCFALAKALAGAKSGAQREFLVPNFGVFNPTQSQLVVVGLLLASFVYFVSSDAQGGRSIGKRWFNLRVCRRDGRDLGLLRALIRTILLFPGIALLVPVSAAGFAFLRGGALDGHAQEIGPLAAIGAGWLLALYFVGSASAAGRPLHDVLVGAIAYRAQRSRFASVGVTGRRELSAGRAMRLSIVPGLGVMYAGRIVFGLLFMGTITVLLFRHPPLGVLLWVASAGYAHWLATRPRAQRGGEAGRAPDPVVRRQES
jgi:uncharacterized RDD family membrane protein YckC